MRGFGTASAAAAVIAATSFFVSTVVADVDPIVIKGSKFFYKTNGTQFFMKGVAYQQDYTGNGSTAASTNEYTDPLADEAGCSRDIPYLQQLQTNTVRVYAINPTSNHDACMTALANAGIYVVADLSAPGQSINRADPAWNDELYTRYTGVVDAMAKYNNVLGFFAGNEVSNAPNNTDASAFVKAAVRDTKAYIKQRGYRTIGVGYATNDDASIRENMADYFNCGDQASAIDFWGYNIYSWCGQSSYQQSGYNDRTQEFSSYSVPAFFAEYGCNTPSPRGFSEVQALYGSQMTPVWSGGIVYMYFQEENNYGLVSVSGNSVTPNQDFKNLASQIAKASPSGVAMSAYNPTNSPQACPTEDGSSWAAKATPLPPSPNPALCSCMYQSLGCVVAPNTDASDFEDLFGTVCGYGAAICAGIAANSTTGTYGAYGMCNDTEKLGFAFNNYYAGQSSSASACDFSGAATVQAAATNRPSSCSALMAQAGTAGTGTVTSVPSGTAGSGSGGSSGGAAGSSASKSSAAGAGHVQSVENSLGPVVFFAAVAAVSGVGMIFL